MDQISPAPTVAAAASSYAKVFVSYSRKDLPFAQMLVAALVERGFDAFLDKTDIAPGDPWKERLAGLIAAADTVVFRQPGFRGVQRLLMGAGGKRAPQQAPDPHRRTAHRRCRRTSAIGPPQLGILCR